MTLRSILTLALLVSGPTASAQTTYYVDASATPPGLGTQAEPWTSIQTAIDVPTITGSDTILVAPGTYPEHVSNKGKSFMLRSSDGPHVTEIRPTGAGTVLGVGGPSIVTLSGFTIAGATQGSDGVFVNGALSMSDCIVRDNADEGLASNGDVLVERCTFTENGTGIFSWAGADYTIRDSIIWNNTTYDLALIGGGTYGSYDVRHSLFSWSKSTVGPAGGPLFNNLHRDPRWWDPAAEDLFLRPRSLCIGAGITGGDMGALPYDPGHAPTTPTTYCYSKPNSLGCWPAIGFSGTPTAGGGIFDVECTSTLNNKLGLLFYGYQAKHKVYQGGWLCVQAPVKRTPNQPSGGNPPPDDCSGVYSYDFGGLIASGADPALVAGASVFAQYWYRDPNDPSGFTTGRSDALAFTIQP